MANIFRTFTSRNIGTSLTSVGNFNSPGANVSTVIGLAISNKSNSAILVDVAHASNTANTFIIKNAPITAGSTLVPIGGDQKIVLHGESIKVSANSAGAVDAVMSVLIQNGA